MSSSFMSVFHVGDRSGGGFVGSGPLPDLYCAYFFVALTLIRGVPAQVQQHLSGLREQGRSFQLSVHP